MRIKIRNLFPSEDLTLLLLRKEVKFYAYGNRAFKGLEISGQKLRIKIENIILKILTFMNLYDLYTSSCYIWYNLIVTYDILKSVYIDSYNHLEN